MARVKTERIPWVVTPDALKPYAPGVWDPDAGPAELYYLPDDFTQAHDLAADHPDKVQELKDLFWEEARSTRCCRCSPPCPRSSGSSRRCRRRPRSSSEATSRTCFRG